MTDKIEIQKTGRRYYLRGNTYPIRKDLGNNGFHWDRDERAWWTSKKALAERYTAQDIQARINERPSVFVEGNTYPIREELKKMGGVWNKERKAWCVPTSRAEEARALVADQPAKQPRSPRSEASTSRGGRCAECGRYTRYLEDCTDSSGIVAGCCSRCAKAPAWERSFA